MTKERLGIGLTGAAVLFGVALLIKKLAPTNK